MRSLDGSAKFNAGIDPQGVFAYDKKLDHARLTGQIRRIFVQMSDREWRTLYEISALTGDPESSVSAQLRHLRKKRFGSHLVEKRRRGAKTVGLWEYRLTVNTEPVDD